MFLWVCPKFVENRQIVTVELTTIRFSPQPDLFRPSYSDSPPIASANRVDVLGHAYANLSLRPMSFCFHKLTECHVVPALDTARVPKQQRGAHFSIHSTSPSRREY